MASEPTIREAYEAGFDQAMDMLGVARAVAPRAHRDVLLGVRRSIERSRDECADRYEAHHRPASAVEQEAFDA